MSIDLLTSSRLRIASPAATIEAQRIEGAKVVTLVVSSKDAQITLVLSHQDFATLAIWCVGISDDEQ